jgi:membrane-bound lytic murein transglycosylase D
MPNLGIGPQPRLPTTVAMGGYNGAMTTQGESSFYKILLPEETMRYIFRIAALKYILDNQDRFGFRLTDDVIYHPLNLRRETISSGVGNLVAYAKSKGTDYKTIRMLNPWIRSSSLSNTKAEPILFYCQTTSVFL